MNRTAKSKTVRRLVAPARCLVAAAATATAVTGVLGSAAAADPQTALAAELPQPTVVRASAATERVTVRWDYPTDTRVTQFRVLDLTNGRTIVARVGPTALRATVPARTRGQKQVLAVVARDGQGDRARSARVSVTVPSRVMLTGTSTGAGPQLHGVSRNEPFGGAVVQRVVSAFPALSVHGELAMACSDIVAPDPDLCLGDPDGGERRVIAGRSTGEEYGLQWLPAWSHDGKRLAYAAGPASDNLHIVVLDPATGERTRVPHSRRTTEPTWTPDGRIVARSQSTGKLVLIDPRTGSRQRLDHTEQSAFPSVSPDGELAFTQVDPELQRQVVVVRSLDGTERQVLPLGRLTTWVTFTPDGEHLTVLTFTRHGTQRIVLLERDGEEWVRSARWATSSTFLTRTVFYDSTDYPRERRDAPARVSVPAGSALSGRTHRDAGPQWLQLSSVLPAYITTPS